MDNIIDVPRSQRYVTRTHTVTGPARAATSSRLSVKHLLRLLFVFCLALLLPAGTVFAQATHGVISGTVVDRQGASIPGANVALRNQLTTVSETTQTNNTGYFVFPAVLPGIYTISAGKEGFEKLEKTDIHILPADRLDLGTLQLKVGSTLTTVTVTGEGTPVQTTSSDQSAVITSSQMASLPSIGRDYMALMRTLPGSAFLGEGNAQMSTLSSIAQFEGQSSLMATYVSTNGVFSSVSKYTYDNQPPVMDNIEDVKVLAANYEPQYGSVTGAVINVTTKSGTANFRGGAYYYGRNEDLNANDFFNNRLGLMRSRYRYNTIGGTLGGPIYGPGRFKSLRDKLFFFFSYDNDPGTTPAGPRLYIMPTALERTGDFSQSYIPGSTTQLYKVINPATGLQFPGNSLVGSAAINTTMQKVLNIFPLPNFTNTAISRNSYNYVVNDSNQDPTDFASLRIDYAVTDKWRIFGRWQRSFSGTTGHSVAAGIAGWEAGPMSYNLEDTKVEANATYTINPHMVNQFAIGYISGHESHVVPQSTLNQFTAAATGITLPEPYPQNNPLGVIPAMAFTNGPSFSFDPRFPIDDPSFNYSVNEGFIYIRNNHQLKFGVYSDAERAYEKNYGSNFAGVFVFSNPNPSNPFNTGNSFAEALLGYFDQYVVATSRVLVGSHVPALEWYAQDNWRASKKLSLSFGARFTGDVPSTIAGNGGQLVFSRYKASDAPPLFQPVKVNGTRMMQNPVTGALEPATYQGYFVPGVGNPAPGSITPSDPGWYGYFYGTGVHVAPRVGFAYDVFGDGKTAIRGGFGVFIGERDYGGMAFAQSTNPPAVYYPTQFYGNIATFVPSSGLLSPSNTTYLDPTAGLPYTLQWNLGIQREVGFKSVLGVAYVANASHKVPYSINRNAVPYGAEFLAQNQDPTTGTPLPDNYFRPYPGYAAITEDLWGNSANYNSLQVTFDRRFSRNLAYGVAYTWSKSLDDRRSTTYLPASITYGPSSINMANRLTANWVWDLPKTSGHWNNLFSREALDNWQLSGIASFISGVPVSAGLSTTNGENITGGGDGARVIVTGNAVLPKSQRTFNRYFNTSAFALPAVGQIGTQWVPSLYGPGVNDWDMALTKNIRIKERVAVQLRTEWYNAFNHTQFSSLNTTATFNPATGAQANTAFGQLTADRGPRIIQMSLRLTF